MQSSTPTKPSVEASGYFLPEYVWSAYRRNGAWYIGDRLPTDIQATTSEQIEAIEAIGLQMLFKQFRRS